MDNHIEEWEHLMNEVDACETEEQLDMLIDKVIAAMKLLPKTIDILLLHRMDMCMLGAEERLL